MDGLPSVMNGAQFAKLIDRSEMAVSKYRANGHLQLDADDKIKPFESLIALEGHMEEHNRQLGLRRLGGGPDEAPAPANDQPPPRSAKAELDEIKRDNALLDLGERAGELIEVAEVERRAYAAVAKMREAQEVALIETVEIIAGELKLPPDRAAMVKKHLKRMNSKAFGAFSAAMLAAAAAEEDTSETPDAEPAGALL